MSRHRISTSRRSVQALLLIGITLIPFLQINGNPVVRMDIGQRTLFLIGAAVRIDQFYLVLLTTLVMVSGFLLLTVILGRVWCGWLCPQTVLNDLNDLAQDLLRPVLPEPALKMAAHIFALLFSIAVSLNLLCWFMPPIEVIKSLSTFHAHPVVTVCFSVSTVVLYLNLVMVKRDFCRSYCPYGRFQAALLDAGTLNLSFLEETRERCIRCGGCVKVCPMDIDIRQGFQIECINCGRCIDACRSVMDRKGYDGLIAYRFGEAIGGGPRIGTKTVSLAVLVSVLLLVLAWGIYARSDTAFSVQRIATAEPKTFSNGSQVQAWRGIVGNRGQSAADFSIALSPLSGTQTELLGPVRSIRIAPNENRQVSFFIRFNRPITARQSLELQLFREGVAVASVKVTP